jgi:hypothetical protein
MAVQGHDGFQLHENQAGAPFLPDPGQANPKKTVALMKLGTPDAALKNEELMPEGEDFEEMLRTVLDEGPQEGEEETEKEHCWLPE